MSEPEPHFLKTFMRKMLQSQRQQGERMGSSRKELHEARETDESWSGKKFHCQ